MSYRWYPNHTRSSSAPPVPGDLIAYDHAAWRVIAVNPIPEDRWTDQQRADLLKLKPSYRHIAEPVVVIARPVEITSDDPRARDRDIHLGNTWHAQWHIYEDEHYPICAQCGEPTPCRDKVGQRIAERALDYMARFETAGICPACQKPVTSRQKSMTFPENLEVLGGPPVTFHVGRGACLSWAAKYERKWVDAEPVRRRATLSCPGHLTNHNDGTYDCTQLNDCPGAQAVHPSYTVCCCPDCHARGAFDCHPAPSARRNEGEAGE